MWDAGIGGPMVGRLTSGVHREQRVSERRVAEVRRSERRVAEVQPSTFTLSSSGVAGACACDHRHSHWRTGGLGGFNF